MEPLRLGVLGAARISEAAIVLPAQATGARLVAIAARDSHRGAAFAAQHGFERVLPSYLDVINDAEVEAIYNPLTNGQHGPWNLIAIAAGKSVLTEKPFASNAAEAIEVRDAAQAAGVQVIEAFHYRYHPVMKRVLALVAAGTIGDVVGTSSIMVSPITDTSDPRWSFDLAGGAMMDRGCYAVHAFRTLGGLLGGEPVATAARAGERDLAAGVDEWLDADFMFPNGVIGHLFTSMISEVTEYSLRVVGTRGEIFAPNFVLPHRDDRVIVTIDEVERVEHLGVRPSYTYQLEAFIDLLRNGVAMPTGANDAVRQMQLIDSCYQAAGLAPRPRMLTGW